MTVLLALNAALSVAAAVAQVGELRVLERFQRSDPVTAGEIVDAIDRSELIGAIGLWLFFVTGVAWLLWQFRAHANLRSAHVADLEFTPGWTVGWWFVPFANLVKPFQTVRELWKASTGDPEWKRTGTWPVIGWWWASWAAAAVIGFAVGFNAGFRSKPLSVESLIDLDRLGLILVIPSIAATVLAIVIVRSVTRRQTALSVVAAAARDVVPPRPDLPDRRFGSGL